MVSDGSDSSKTRSSLWSTPLGLTDEKHLDKFTPSIMWSVSTNVEIPLDMGFIYSDKDDRHLTPYDAKYPKLILWFTLVKFTNLWLTTVYWWLEYVLTQSNRNMHTENLYVVSWYFVSEIIYSCNCTSPSPPPSSDCSVYNALPLQCCLLSVIPPVPSLI